MHPNTFLRIVQEEAGLHTLTQAETATKIVFQLLHNRITPEEAADVEAQLPRDLAAIWEGGAVWTERLLYRFTPRNKFNRREFIAEVEKQQDSLPTSGEQITRAVFYALQHQITPGEAEDIAAQLPMDVRALWQESSPAQYRPMASGPVDEPQGLRWEG